MSLDGFPINTEKLTGQKLLNALTANQSWRKNNLDVADRELHAAEVALGRATAKVAEAESAFELANQALLAFDRSTVESADLSKMYVSSTCRSTWRHLLTKEGITFSLEDLYDYQAFYGGSIDEFFNWIKEAMQGRGFLSAEFGIPAQMEKLDRLGISGARMWYYSPTAIDGGVIRMVSYVKGLSLDAYKDEIAQNDLRDRQRLEMANTKP